ncbi:hypothetical protein CU102_26420 [Phyllobacterium brassicacearum]|uniref:GapR-like DNA-binding domain-containing protein n=1 Tax=Phyllobacterium brassicacearum TaxID=314235 RepID=A0A2P7B5M4_9HYPH|nr:GapR family DNA-binding domain-containing protein [Phyllobacterium brassicacearum]PSH61720.1 hypothetical protein CU102_26420 [Phyllobacterium brassicacearum]TDQ15326.1 uncharacterized protein (UPF0335 family) [Phyllobacterium brassicacearum]
MSSNSKLQRLVDKIERLDETIKEHNAEKSEVYKDAKSDGYDVKALRKVIAIRRKGHEKHEEEEATVATYLAELG